MKAPLTVLLTNDDGFYAQGLQTLYESLTKVAQVIIVAPDRERSAVGHGITMHQPLRTSLVTIDNINHWLVNGTPSDCVKLALECLLEKKTPDLLISGINRGPNLGNDILYSGTVSAAIEGSIYKIPSIAASVGGYGKVDFKPAADFLSAKLLDLKRLATMTTLNLNFPILEEQVEYKGIKFTKLGQRIYENVFDKRQDPRQQTYYWMGGEPVKAEQDPDSDIKALAEGYISITPLKYDLTDYQFLKVNNNLSLR